MDTFNDPNSSYVKSETKMNTPSDPNSISLPSRLCECKCEVVLIKDVLQCGVVQLVGANRKAYCLFFRKDFLSRNQGDQKLSTQVPVGTKLVANARLIKEKSVIPFLATSIWEVGAIRRENELSKLFSNLESQEIEQFSMLSRDLEWFLPRGDCLNNCVNKGVTDDFNESNNNNSRYCQGQSRNMSPRYRLDQKRSPGHHIRYKNRSRSPTHHSSKARSRSPRDYPGRTKSKSSTQHSSQARSRSPKDYPGRTKSKGSTQHSSQARSRSPKDYPDRTKSKGSTHHSSQARSRTRSRSPRDYPDRTKSKGSTHHSSQARSRTRSRSPKDYPGRTKSKSSTHHSRQARSRSPKDYPGRTKSKGSTQNSSQARSRSPKAYPGRTKSKGSTQNSSQARSRSPKDYPGRTKSKGSTQNSSQARSRTRSRSPKDYLGRTKSKSSTQHSSQVRSRTRSRSPRDYPGRTESKNQRCAQRQEDLNEFSEEERIKNQIKNMEVIKSELPERFRPNQTRSRSPRDYHGRNESITKRLMLLASMEGEVPPLRNQEAKKRLENEIENIGRIKIEATEINYQQELKKSENQSEESLKWKWENKESASISSTIIKEIGDLIVRHNYSKGSSSIEEGKNEDKTCGGEKYGSMQDIPTKVPIKKTGEMHKPTIQTSQPVSDMSFIVNGKGKVLQILDKNYGIAIVLGFGRLCRVLFDTYDVWIDSQVCADLGKTLFDVMQEGDLVCLQAIPIENPPRSSTGQQIQYLATSVKRVSNIEALLKSKITDGGVPSTLEEVSEDKIKNFHEVAKAVLDMQGEEAMVNSIGKDEIPIDIGILYKRNETTKFVNFFCFHCKFGHCDANIKKEFSKSTSWESHYKHVLNCTNLKCLENGEKKFQDMKISLKTKQELKNAPKTKQARNEKGGFITPRNMATEKEEVLQAKEFQRLSTHGNAGKSESGKLYCFHCQYEGVNMNHFTSKNHQDHVKACGKKILDCPENPKVSLAVHNLMVKREMLCLPRGNISSSYHQYFCLHCKEPFSDKRHVQGEKHKTHMARNSCVPTCKFVQLAEGKYVKWCFICDVKLVASHYQAHVKSSQHSRSVLNLLKKKVHVN